MYAFIRVSEICIYLCWDVALVAISANLSAFSFPSCPSNCTCMGVHLRVNRTTQLKFPLYVVYKVVRRRFCVRAFSNFRNREESRFKPIPRVSFQFKKKLLGWDKEHVKWLKIIHPRFLITSVHIQWEIEWERPRERKKGEITIGPKPAGQK